MGKRAILAALVLLAGGCGKKTDANRAALEKQFAESLSGATLEGHYTMGRDGKLREDKYTIQKVSKIGGNLWLFEARVQYGSRDVTVPMPLPVEWAGDTPVVELTDLTIPGLGTYTARVLFYKDQYVGTWKHKDAGGQLFGRIVKNAGERRN